jgi:hypothetical protein
MDVKVWIMGGVVLQGPGGLVMPMLSRAKKQYLCASNVYYDRGRIVAVLPFFPFLDSFFFTFPLKTPSGMTGKPVLSSCVLKV